MASWDEILDELERDVEALERAVTDAAAMPWNPPDCPREMSPAQQARGIALLARLRRAADDIRIRRDATLSELGTLRTQVTAQRGYLTGHESADRGGSIVAMIPERTA